MVPEGLTPHTLLCLLCLPNEYQSSTEQKVRISDSDAPMQIRRSTYLIEVIFWYIGVIGMATVLSPVNTFVIVLTQETDVCVLQITSH